MRSTTPQHSPFLPHVALSHGEHGRAEAHKQHDARVLNFSQ